MAKKKVDEFELLKDLPEETRDPEISQDDFVLVDNENRVHEEKFQTKPTTFFKDCVHRFMKNKSSVVATFILGFLVLLAIIIPAVSPYDVSQEANNIGFEYLEPKLFNAGTGFWDGTRKYKDYSVDVSLAPNAKTDEEKNEKWWPDPKFVHSAISKKEFTDEKYTNAFETYGKGGFLRFSILKSVKDDVEQVELYTNEFTTPLDFSKTTIEVTSFDTYDLDKINKLDDETAQPFDSDYSIAETTLNLVTVTKDSDDNDVKTFYPLTETKKVHNIGSFVSSLSEPAINVADALPEEVKASPLTRYYFSVTIANEKDKTNKSALIKSLTYNVTGDDVSSKAIKQVLCDYTEDDKTYNGASFVDATKCGNEDKYLDSERTKLNPAYLNCNSSKRMFMAKAIFMNFVYDTYEAKLGTHYTKRISLADIDQWRTATKNKWNGNTKKKLLDLNIDIMQVGGKWVLNESTFYCEILDERCPLAKKLVASDISVNPYGPTSSLPTGYEIDGYLTLYKYYGYEEMPKFLFGTDAHGKDMLKYVFDGLRYSLLLGIVSSAVCFIFGLVWGAICGYFGGNVDLIMERFTDILSGIPWIVVMTLVIIHIGSNFFSFALALCLTGWIGTAATTRTQFYRFRGREYVLASRTLGASHARLIRKHILPNAMGTIITSAVLMIPSVIFSEATISYLGLGFRNLSSLGVILSYNQGDLKTYPYLVIFPAVVIALLMISFNLFGNGLRDAVNPSLKGEGES